jgi:hypothetical protein
MCVTNSTCNHDMRRVVVCKHTCNSNSKCCVLRNKYYVTCIRSTCAQACMHPCMYPYMPLIRALMGYHTVVYAVLLHTLCVRIYCTDKYNNTFVVVFIVADLCHRMNNMETLSFTQRNVFCTFSAYICISCGSWDAHRNTLLGCADPRTYVICTLHIKCTRTRYLHVPYAVS